MYVGTQVEPRDDSDYQVWAQLGVTHVCVDPPGSVDQWSLDALRRHKDHVESFGLSLDMVQLPISSGPLEAEDEAHVLIARDPEWQREVDRLCGLIERLAAAGIPAAKYNLSVLGVPRTARNRARGFAKQGVPMEPSRPERVTHPGRRDLRGGRTGRASTVSMPRSYR